MKVIEKNGKICLQADFYKLTDNERNFMSDLGYKFIFWNFIEEDVAGLVERENITPRKMRDIVFAIRQCSISHFIEIDESARVLFDGIVEKSLVWEREEFERKKKLETLENAVKDMQYKQREGCGLCPNLKRVNGSYICGFASRSCRFKQSEKEIEFEAWKEAKALNIPQEYYAMPYPTIGCEYIVKGNQAFMELQEIRNN